MGLPNNQWVYVDQVRFPVDEESNIFQGNIDVSTAFISDTLTFANNANINSDLQIADLRCKVTCRIDKYNTSTDGFARMSNIEKLYCANNGLNNGI